MELELSEIIIDEQIDLGSLELDVLKIQPTLIKKEIVDNGNYSASDDNVDGYSEIDVNVNIPKIQENITKEYKQNGKYTIVADENYDAIKKVEVDVDVPMPKLGIKTITDNGTYKAIDDELDGYSEVNVQLKGTESQFTGHYDKIGLKTIGWSDDEINYYQKNGVQWNDTEDEYFRLTDTELIGDDSKNTRFLPKNTTKKDFINYYKLLAIPQLDTSKVTNMRNMFSYCYSLTTIPQLDTSEVTNMSSMFSSCYALKTISMLDTSNITNMSNMFIFCNSLTTIPLLNTSKVTNMSNMFGNCYSLTNFGGLENLGQAYSTTQSANYSNYKLDLSTCTALTEQSLINVLNNLYDIKTKGCKVQQVVLGSTNLAKLVSEEGQQALTNATAKGWTIS